MAYKEWAFDNKELLQSIREKFKQADIIQKIKHDKLTDMKLLDLIFWSKANKNEKKTQLG